MKQYKIYDVCVADQKDSDWYKKELLDKPLDKECWLSLLMKEIEAYCDCMTEENITNHWKKTIKDLFWGGPVEINGLEFVIENKEANNE